MTSRGLALVATLLVAAVVSTAGSADAAPRKRVVVLDFTGVKADKFHDDVVRLVKKSYTLVPTDKWTGTADDLGATKPSDANVAKIAKKLKVDGIIIGKIEQRRGDYVVHLKLRNGHTGSIANTADTKTSGPRLDAKASMDVKDELLDAIDQLGQAKAGGGDDSDDSSDDDADAKPAPKKKPAAKKGKPAADDDADDDADSKPAPKKKPAAKKPAPADDDDDDASAAPAPKKSGFGKKKPAADDDDDVADAKPAPAPKKAAPPPAPKKKPAPATDADDVASTKAPDSSHDDDDSPLKTLKKPAPAAKKPAEDGSSDKAASDDSDADTGGKKVAAKDGGDDDSGGSVSKSSGDAPVSTDLATQLSPGRRAVDATLGISFIARSLGFTHTAALTNDPPGYKGVPVAGAILDVTVFPGAIGHERKGILANLGLILDFDKVLHVTSQSAYTDATGAKQVTALPTSSSRFYIGAALRHPFGDSATAPVLTGSLSYGKQSFTIVTSEPNNMTADIPSVSYAMLEPAVSFRYPISPKLELMANAGAQIISNAGEIATATQYGTATVFGFEFAAGGDYLITSKIFARALFSFETIGFTFKGNGALSNGRDGDMATQDVFGARDSYYGGIVTVGYLY